MSTLIVNPEGLYVLAARCGVLAGELEQSTAHVSGSSGHAAAAAVQELHGAVSLVGAAMAARLQELSDNLVHGGVLFSNNEAESADEFGALSPPVWM